jgi:hypothetical protein
MSNEDLDWYDKKLGKLWNYLLSLEVLLRVCILIKSKQESSLRRLDILKAGDIVDENALTNYDGLEDVIKRFNSSFKKEDWVVDKDKIVHLRHVLAHGRLISFKLNYPVKIFKFAEPVDSDVKVEFTEEMTSDWFDANLDFLYYELDRIVRIFEGLKSKKKSQ